MRVATFMYCEATENLVVPNGPPKIQIKAPLLTFFPQFIPTNFSFSIVCGILGLDLFDQHTVKVKFINLEKNEVIVETDEMMLPKANEPATLPVNLNEIVFTMDLRNVVLASVGSYTTEIYIDKELLGKFPVEVWLR